MLEKYKEYLDHNEGELNTKGLKCRFSLLIIPVLIDFVLTIIDFFLSSDYKLVYFILRIITQIFGFLLCLSYAYFLSYVNSDGMDGIPHCLAITCSTCYTSLLEIACLVFFIKYFSSISLFQKIVYFSHWILIPFIVVCCCINKHYSKTYYYLNIQEAVGPDKRVRVQA